MNSELETKMSAKEYLHDKMDEWDTVFDPPVKCEYTEEQMIRFAEMWAEQQNTHILYQLKDIIYQYED